MKLDYKKLGKNISKRRLLLGIKQVELGELTGLSQKYLSNIENAKSIPSLETLLLICEALKTTPNELLLGITEQAYDLEAALTEAIMELSYSPQKSNLVLDFINTLDKYDF